MDKDSADVRVEQRHRDAIDADCVASLPEWFRRIYPRYFARFERDLLATPSPAVLAEQAEMAAFGASDAACYLYPGTDQEKERAAFCAGAAHAVSSPSPAPAVAEASVHMTRGQLEEYGEKQYWTGYDDACAAIRANGGEG